MAKLRREAERAKRALSSQHQVRVLENVDAPWEPCCCDSLLHV